MDELESGLMEKQNWICINQCALCEVADTMKGKPCCLGSEEATCHVSLLTAGGLRQRRLIPQHPHACRALLLLPGRTPARALLTTFSQHCGTGCSKHPPRRKAPKAVTPPVLLSATPSTFVLYLRTTLSLLVFNAAMWFSYLYRWKWILCKPRRCMSLPLYPHNWSKSQHLEYENYLFIGWTRESFSNVSPKCHYLSQTNISCVRLFFIHKTRLGTSLIWGASRQCLTEDSASSVSRCCCTCLLLYLCPFCWHSPVLCLVKCIFLRHFSGPQAARITFLRDTQCLPFKVWSLKNYACEKLLCRNYSRTVLLDTCLLLRTKTHCLPYDSWY